MIVAVIAAAASLALPKPDATYAAMFGRTHYRCQQWGGPPRPFMLICRPVKQPAKGAA